MAQSKNDDTEDEGSKYEEFHVLAVDDNIIDRKIIEGLLRRSSCQVTSVKSVRKALEFLGLEDDEQGRSNADKVRVNMIITDYCMPELTGYDLLKRIKESSALKDIPVVIMSSENVECRRKRCLSEGAEEFLMKPVQLSDIMKLRSQMLKWRSCQQQPTSTKRKNMSDNNNSSISPQAERRPRLSGLTVA